MTISVEPLHTVPGNVFNDVISNVGATRGAIEAQAGQLFTRGDTLVTAAQNAINAIATSLVDPGPGVAPTAPALPTAPGAPVVSVTSNFIDAPRLPDIPVFEAPSGDYQPTPVAIPAAPSDLPSINVPAMPSPTMPGAPAQPNINIDTNLPDAPQLAIPSAPTVAGITLPQLPVITLPTFDAGLLPTWTEAPPQLPDIAAGVPTAINDALLQAFGTKVQNDQPATITAVYDQELVRQADTINRQASQDIDALWDEVASRGFFAPPGALARRIDALRADAASRVRVAARDLALARLTTELDTYRANIAAGVELARLQIDKDLQAARLKLEILVAASRNMIDLYNALVEVFKARMMAAQISAEVYRTQLQGEISKIELYTKQVDAQRAVVDASVAQMQGYEAQVRGVLAQVDIYKAQIDGARARIQAQAQVLDVFRGEVDSYVAQVGAVKSIYDAYDSQVRGAIAPVQLYEARMRGYAAEVDGARAAVEMEKVKADIARSQDDIAIQAYTANINALLKQGDLSVEAVRANAAVEQTRLSAADTQARAVIASFQGQIEAYRAQSTVAVSNYEAAIKAFEVTGNFNQQRAALRVEASRGAAQVSAQLASSALAGLHIQESISASANLGFNAGSQGSWNYQYQEQHQFEGE